MLLFLGTINAQIHFEKGYFILNDGTKTDCLIKNNEWDNSPNKIFYKLNENSEVIKLDASEILEFSISNSIKYGRFDVELDESSENLNKLSLNKEPIFTKKNVLLKYLVEGSANLYLYSVSNTVKYFYSVNKSNPTQLIYKKYFLSDRPDQIRINDSYKQQLLNNINSKDYDYQHFEKMEFTQNDLEKHFIEFNQSKGDFKLNDFKTTNNIPKNGKLKFGPTLGISNTALTITNVDYQNQSLNFDSSTSISIGVELEYIFRFYKNKWSLFTNPNYNKNSSSANFNYSTLSIDLNEKVNSEIKIFELPIGIRHYVFLNDKSKIFFNLAALVSLIDVSTIQSKNDPDMILNKFKTNQQSFSLGAGFSQNKISAEIRYNSKIDLDKYLFRNSDYNKLSLILKYNIF